MNLQAIFRRRPAWLIFTVIFLLCLGAGALLSQVQPAEAAPAAQDSPSPVYAGSSACISCHTDMFTDWVKTRHSNAYASAIFQRDWAEVGKDPSCLECHTTGFNPANGSYAEAGVTCEACHGPFQPLHPNEAVPFTPSVDVCSGCHKGTVDEWLTSAHSQNQVECQACHNPHTQTPKAPSVTELCAGCHEARGDSFAHGTHATSGLECSNCHMFTTPRTEDPVMGHVPTGHTFTVGSEACIGCHQDTVHTRDEIITLTDEVAQESIDIAALEQTLTELEKSVADQELAITELRAENTNRLYSGLAFGGIAGLLIGGVTAWTVSRRPHNVKGSKDE